MTQTITKIEAQKTKGSVLTFTLNGQLMHFQLVKRYLLNTVCLNGMES